MTTEYERPIDPVVFWGKLGRVHDETPRFHPLICHMLDVAAVARAMWDDVLSEAAKAAIRDGLGMASVEAARDWVAFLAGAHDLGKCSAAFIFRPEAKALIGHRLYAGLEPWNGSASDAHHGSVNARVLPDLLNNRFGMAKPVAQRLGLVTGGHHGAFPNLTTRVNPDAVGRGRWRAERETLLAAYASTMTVPEDDLPRHIDNATAMELAGLISVADWIGSDEEQFSYYFDRSDGLLTVDLPTYRDPATIEDFKGLILACMPLWIAFFQCCPHARGVNRRRTGHRAPTPYCPHERGKVVWWVG